MKYYDWNEKKNEWLKRERGISFEMAVLAIESGNLLDRVKNVNQNKYPNQKVLIIKIENYVYSVPYVEDEEKIFLKTIIPSRKATKKYLENK
jgi:hypothetical protein